MNESGYPVADHSRLLSVGKTANYLGVTKKQIYYWMKNHRIPFIRIGRLVFFDRVELEEWLSRNRIPSCAQ